MIDHMSDSCYTCMNCSPMDTGPSILGYPVTEGSHFVLMKHGACSEQAYQWLDEIEETLDFNDSDELPSELPRSSTPLPDEDDIPVERAGNRVHLCFFSDPRQCFAAMNEEPSSGGPMEGLLLSAVTEHMTPSVDVVRSLQRMNIELSESRETQKRGKLRDVEHIRMAEPPEPCGLMNFLKACTRRWRFLKGDEASMKSCLRLLRPRKFWRRGSYNFK